MMCATFRLRFDFVILVSALVITGGCAKGPFWRTGYIAPWALKRWSEEERFAETLHTKRENLRAIVQTAAQGTAADQENAAKQLVDIIETNPVRLVRIEAVRLLGDLDSPTAESGLLRAAKDPSSEVRLAAVHACGSKSNLAALRALQEMVGADTDVDVRLAAARQLQYFKEPGAIQALALALEDPNPALQIRAADSLQVVTGQGLGRDIQAWRQYARAQLPSSPTETQTSLSETQTAEQRSAEIQLR